MNDNLLYMRCVRLCTKIARTVRTSCSITQNVAHGVEIFPHDQSLDSTEIQSFQGVVNAEAVFTSILADLIEISLDKFLLLNEFDVGKRLG
jgi:hypothetical protein